MQTGQRRTFLPQADKHNELGPRPGETVNADDGASLENRLSEIEKARERGIAISGLPAPPFGAESDGAQMLIELQGLLPSVDVYAMPQPDPVRSALEIVLGNDSAAQGGLWVTGNVTKAMEVLRWIAGDEHTELLHLDGGSRVRFRTELLAAEAGAESLDRMNAALVIADYIAGHEGLLLLTALTQGNKKYLLHIGNSAPTLGEHVKVSSTINLDLNFDSRINPRRPNRQKVLEELPPEGFDSMVAVNPTTRWVSVQNRRNVPLASVVLHELAEAHAKAALGLEYLPKDGRAGAHDLAIDCELRFAQQRPFSGTELTTGWIRVFGSEEQ